MGRAARLSLVLLACACGEPATERTGHSSAHARGPVVARVQGSAIGLEEVRELSLATGLSPREALSRLEDALVLEQTAIRLGYDRSGSVMREARRALVRALLAQTVEAEVRPETIPEADVRAHFESERARRGLSAESYPDHAAAAREQLALERRKVALDNLIAELRANTPVSLDEPEVRKTLSDPSLWGGGT
jgi:hypothetical protein